jgi:hypothetical protein
VDTPHLQIAQHHEADLFGVPGDFDCTRVRSGYVAVCRQTSELHEVTSNEETVKQDIAGDIDTVFWSAIDAQGIAIGIEVNRGASRGHERSDRSVDRADRVSASRRKHRDTQEHRGEVMSRKFHEYS